MKSKLRIIMSVLLLSGCQTVDTKLSKLMPVAKDVNSENIPIVAIGIIEDADTDSDGVIDKLDMCPGTPPNLVVDARGCPFDLLLIGALKMEYRAFFAKGSSDLSPEYQLELDKIAEKLQEYDTATMRIEGHASVDETSDIGLRPNSLSMNRALIVKNYLVMQHQIDPNRLSISSYSAKQPIASSDTEEGNSMNRRVYGVAEEPQN